MATYFKEENTVNIAEIIKLMSEHKISPELLDIGDDFTVTKKIRYCINDIDGRDCTNDDFKNTLASVYPDVSLEEFCGKVTEKVRLMKSLDVCHGDLHLGNIVFEKSETGEFKVYIIDWETSFNISTGFKGISWTSWDGPRYNEYMNTDFTTWKRQAYMGKPPSYSASE